MMAAVRLVIAVVGILVVSTWGELTSRILGGEEASKDSFAYVASVRLDGAHICGGSIIGPRKILTAAHCVTENGNIVSSNRFAVRVGSTNQFSGGKLHYVSTISVHPKFAGEKNDIAIVVLKLPLAWTARVAMIAIAKDEIDEPAAGNSVVVAGWGEQSANVSSHKLHLMSFTIATEDVCLNAYNEIDNSNICLAHDLKKGSCLGDAGNGAVYKKKLVGVSSFIVGACGSRYPDIFSKVAYYASWIQTVKV